MRQGIKFDFKNLYLGLMTILALIASGCSDGRILGVKIGGTSDSGGGNGIDNKVYEAYVVDPILLPAFKVHLAQIFMNLKKNYVDTSKTDDFDNSLSFLTYKTWYIAPVEFVTVSKDTLGMSFYNGTSEQLAIQTSREIWIKKNLFEKMTLKEQSDLLVHEFVMNMYFIKFLGLVDFCKITTKGDRQRICITAVQPSEYLYPAEPQRALNSEDYQNIRRATAFMLRQGATASRAEMDQMFRNNGFDYRVFSQLEQKPQPPSSPISASQLKQIFEIGNLTHTLPSQCQFKKFQIDTECSLSATTVSGTDSDFGLQSLQIGIAVNGKEIRQIKFLLEPVEYFLTPFQNPMTGEVVNTIPSFHGIKNPKIGGKTSFVTLVATSKNLVEKEYQLTAIGIRPLMYTHSIKQNGNEYCVYEPYTPQFLEEDHLVINNRPRDLAFIQWMEGLSSVVISSCSH